MRIFNRKKIKPAADLAPQTIILPDDIEELKDFALQARRDMECYSFCFDQQSIEAGANAYERWDKACAVLGEFGYAPC